MSNNENSRLSRLTAILTHLQSKWLITAPELAQCFNVSVRTIYRDTRALEQAGIPIFTEENSSRDIEPLALYNTIDNWILIALCCLRNAYREFRLDRIGDLQIHNDTFKPHDFNLRDYFEAGK